MLPEYAIDIKYIRHQITHGHYTPELKAIISICYYISCYISQSPDQQQHLVTSASTIGMNYCNLFFASSPLNDEKYAPISYINHNHNPNANTNANPNASNTYEFPIYYKWVLFYTLSGYIYERCDVISIYINNDNNENNEDMIDVRLLSNNIEHGNDIETIVNNTDNSNINTINNSIYYAYNYGKKCGQKCKQIITNSCSSMCTQYITPSIIPLIGRSNSTSTSSGISLSGIRNTIQPKLLLILDLYRMVFYYNYK